MNKFLKNIEPMKKFSNQEILSCIEEGLSINAIFENVALKDGSFKKCDLNIAFFESCLVENCQFENCDFRGSALINVKFVNCYFKNCDFRGKDFKEVTIDNTIFNKCKIIDTKFNAALLNNITFKGRLYEVEFFSLKIKTQLLADFSECKIDYVSFKNCDLTLTIRPTDKNLIFVDNLKEKARNALEILSKNPEMINHKILTRRINRYSNDDQYIFNIKNIKEIEGEEFAKNFFDLLAVCRIKND